MKIKFLGAAGTVTGSSYALTSESGKSILIDMGMFQGPPETEAMNYQPFEYEVSHLSGVVVTHAHLDHCGRLPLLPSLGFRGDIWMTPATRDLVELVLYDSAKIAKLNTDTVLYDRTQVDQTLELCRTKDYSHGFRVADFEIVFHDAGHLLGSASLEITDNSSPNRASKIIFSGDLGNSPSPLLKETEKLASANTVVMESTYGNRLHTENNAIEALQHEINIIEKTGGTLLIPAFAMEKTQELLYMIKQLKEDGLVNKQTPIFMDSPMARKATEIYLKYPKLFNQKLQKELKTVNPFEFLGIRTVFKHKDSQAIQEHLGSKVIIAGGGMMTGGRILAHAKFFLKNPRNRIFFVGYQGEETLGREILEGKSPVVIDGVAVHVMADINQTKAMSSHADQNQLIDWLTNIQGVDKVILTHGEEKSRQTLAERIKNDLVIEDVYTPQLNEEITV